MKKSQRYIEERAKTLAIGLIILGVIHLTLSGILSFYWGFVLIALGAFSFLYRKPIVFLFFGIAIITAGISNISYSLLGLIFSGQSLWDYLWLIFGVGQIYWGAIEIVNYGKIR